MRQEHEGRLGRSCGRFFLSSLFLLAGSVLAGCALDVAYRHPAAQGAPEVCSASCSGTSSVEVHSYETPKDARGRSIKGDYILGYVEFDDQGRFHDMSQRSAFFDALRHYRTDHPDSQFLMVAFAHGWKHNASVSDKNIEDPSPPFLSIEGEGGWRRPPSPGRQGPNFALAANLRT